MPSRTIDDRQNQLRARLHELGFDAVRFAAVTGGGLACLDTPRNIQTWLELGLHGDMQWMERSLAKRRDPTLVLPNARSIVLLGVNYWASAFAGPAGGGRPAWARYALYDDYHDTIKPALVQAGRELERLYGVSATDYRYYVDTGPVIERGWAAASGLGFVGKNAMLISRDFGNWLFLAAIITTLELAPDEPIRKPATPAPEDLPPRAGPAAVPAVGVLCGKCTRCLDACPTNAFTAPGVVDARRCISYQTIENKGVIPRELRAGIGNRVYGCDICLEVCPWNRFAREGRRVLLHMRGEITGLDLVDLLRLTPERFAALFKGTPMKRVKLGGLLRNACIVAGNSGDTALLPPLIELARSHPLPLVRAHAVWAVHRLGGGGELVATRTAEQEPTVLAEYEAEDAGVPIDDQPPPANHANRRE